MPKINSNRSGSKVIEQRLAALEARVSELSQLLQEKLGPRPDWRNAIGAITGDDGMREFLEASLKQRDADRIKVRTGFNEPLSTALPCRDEWKQTLGIFGPEDGMEEVFEEAMKLREADREKARRVEARRKTVRKRRKVMA